MRLWCLIELDGEVKPVVFVLPPTSLKRYDFHKAKLWRSSLPVISCLTRLELVPVRKNGFSYAEVEISLESIASKSILSLASQARNDLQQSMVQIGAHQHNAQDDQIEVEKVSA